MTTKAWYLSKTIWLNIIVIAISILSFIQANLGAGALLLAIGVLGIIARSLTTTAISSSVQAQ